MAEKKIVLKMDIHDNKRKNKGLNAIASLVGIDSISVDMRQQTFTVVGSVDPLDVLKKLRKLFPTVLISSVEPVKDKDKEAGEVAEVTYEYLKLSTNNFSEELIIGRGKHGVVYKGVQENGEYFVVKKLHLMPGLDDDEFRKYLHTLMRVQHQNTIQLVGYCHHTAQVMVQLNGTDVSARVEERALCFEYLQEGSLDRHLSNEACELSWQICYKIIKGICEGLHYLHNGSEYPIYHLNLEPKKILLDKDMTPKIGGFGILKHFDSIETFNTSEVAKTSIYVPSEYINRREITKKFDVFSLGVMMIQIMAGKESYSKCANIPSEEFIELVYKDWENRLQATMSELMSHEVRTCIEIALKCVESDRVNRPTISEIVKSLNKVDIVECRSLAQLYRTREFTFEFVQRITNGFSEQNIVGRGGYGTVYKGVLDNKEEIAVKKLGVSQMFYIDDEQFKNELNSLMRVQHKNIARLVGYCDQTTPVNVQHNGQLICASVVERAICFEYLPGGSLDKQLSDEPCRLDWSKCYKIIKGICEGLHYLHHNASSKPIFHLDVKPENILLDKDMQPIITDFGMSRLFNSMETYITQSQDLKGTRGYMPPEYLNRHEISPKFDVFSLGVIIIQIMAGKEGYYRCPPYTPPKQFIQHVRENWRKRLQPTNSSDESEEVRTCIEIALKCVEDDRLRRPTIDQIVKELSKIGTVRNSPIGQKLMALKTMLSLHIKYWLFLLIALVAIFWAWPQFWPESWCREN